MLRISPRLCLLVSLFLSHAACRIERVDVEADKSEPAAELQPAKAMLLAAGMTESDAQKAMRYLCSRRHGRLDGAQLGAALGRVECLRRGRGATSAGAVVIDSRGRWGAAVNVSPDYLASDAATRALRARAGATVGEAIQQPLAACPVVQMAMESQVPLSTVIDTSPATSTAAKPPEAKPEPSPAPVSGARTPGDDLDDEDAGVADPEPTASPIAPVAGEAPAPSGGTIKGARPSLLLRDGKGGFQAALLLPPGDPQAGMPLVPVGFDLVPGQLAYAGPKGAVVAHVVRERSVLMQPSPAATRYYVLTGDVAAADPSPETESPIPEYAALLEGGVNTSAKALTWQWELNDATCAEVEAAR